MAVVAAAAAAGVPLGIHEVPDATEALDLVTLDLSGLLVAHEAEQRPAVVHDVGTAVEHGGAEKLGVDALLCRELPFGRER
ncbi:MAG: hypothetical protein ABR510_13220 [Trueperaceae bacterium]